MRRRLLPAVLAGAWLLALLVNRSLRDVSGASMAPTLIPGDRIVVLPVWVRRPRVGEVVIVRDPRHPSRRTVKRLAALTPDGRHVVLGDNPAASTDSRVFGPVDPETVEAVVLWRLAPFERVRRRRGGAR